MFQELQISDFFAMEVFFRQTNNKFVCVLWNTNLFRWMYLFFVKCVFLVFLSSRSL